MNSIQQSFATNDKQQHLLGNESPPSIEFLENVEKLCPGFQKDPKIALEHLSSTQMDTLLRGVSKSKSTLTERLSIYKTVADSGSKQEYALTSNFENLRIIEEILTIEDIKNRSLLCNKILTYVPAFEIELICNFKNLGFLNALMKCKTLEERLSLSHAILDQGGDWAGGALANNFKELPLNEAGKSEIIFLLDKIIARGWRSAILVFGDLYNLGFEKLSSGDRLSLMKKIISLYATPEYPGFVNSVFSVPGFIKEMLGLDNPQDRFALCRELVEMHKAFAPNIARVLGKCGLEQVAAKDRLELFQLILAQNPGAASDLLRNINELPIQGISPSDLIGIWNETLKGRGNAFKLATQIGDLGIEEASFDERLKFYKNIVGHSYAEAEALVERYNLLKLSPQESVRLLFEIAAIVKETSRLTFAVDVFRKIDFFMENEEQVTEDFYNAFIEFISCSEKISFLLQIYKQIDKSSYSRHHLMHWLVTTAAELYSLNDEHVKAIELSGIITNIFHHQTPLNRYSFLRELLLMDPGDLALAPADPLTDNSNPIRWKKLSWLLLIRMKQLGSSEQDINELRILIGKQREFRNTVRFNTLVQFLFKIIENHPYNEEEIALINKNLRKIFDRKPEKAKKEGKGPLPRVIDLITHDIGSLNNLWCIGREEFFSSLSSEKDSASIFRDKFIDMFNLEEITDFYTRYDNSFNNFRNNGAIFTYLQSINKLPTDKREVVFKVLREYVLTVLNGTFSQERYNTLKSPHLQKVFNKRPLLKKAWLDKGVTEHVNQLAVQNQNNPQAYKEFFRQKIVSDHHLNPGEFPSLCDYLQGTFTPTKKEIGLQDPKDRFQELAIGLCEGILQVEEFITSVLELNLNLGEFQNDLKTLTPQKNSGNYIISESDDPCDLLLIGTEINGSCQRVDGDPYLNVCLAAYLMNGENLPIVIRRERSPEIVARAMLRLMWDDLKQTPVLLLERVYSNISNNPAIYDAILSRAMCKAKSMGIPLVSKEVGHGAPYNGMVGFLGGFAPYTYSDASGGIRMGCFATRDCHVLFTPNYAKTDSKI